MISIITPAHNEESTIKQFVQSAITYLKMKKIPGEVIVAQNGSNDETASILSQLKKQYKPLRILSLPQGNKGLALRTALTEAKGEKLITLDTDLWDSKFVDQSVELLEKYDVVVGSKVIAGAKDGRPLLSRELNYLYNFAIKLFFNFKGTETHAKLSFRKDSLLPLIAKCTSDHLIFDTELIIRAEREGLPRIEIPTTAKEIRGRRFSVLDHLVKTAKNFLILGQTLGFSINRGYLILLIALVIGAFLRFFQFSDWFFFSVDEEHYAYMTRMITVNHHFPLIGGPISGTKLYMAPWFLYFNSIWFWIGNNSVLFAGAVFVFLELLAIIFVFKLAKAVFSERAAALAALLYSSSTLMALFDRHYWNITLVPLISILTFYTLYKYHQSNRKWIIVTALALGFGLSTTFSVFVIFLFALASIVVIKKRTLFQDLAKFLGIVSLLHLPLVFFDLRHEFWLLKGVKELLSGNYTSGSGYLPETLLRSLSLFVETLSQSLAISGPVDVSDVTSICDLGVQRLSSFPGIALVIVVLLSIFTFIALQKRSKTLFLILVFAAVNILSILFFRTDAQSRHFLPFLPLFFVLTGGALGYLIDLKNNLKVPILLIVIVLSLVNLLTLVTSHASYGLSDKMKAVKYIAQNTETGKFHFDSVGDCHKWGYRYLFSYLNHEPASSYLDPEFSWMYQAKPHPQDATVKATIVSPNKNIPQPDWLLDKRKQLRDRAHDRAKFGNVEVYLEKL